MILNNADNIMVGDSQVDKIYCGSTEIWSAASYGGITGVPPVEFTTTATAAKDYRIYGDIAAGPLSLAVRKPRNKNLLPYPYPGFFARLKTEDWTNATWLDTVPLTMTQFSDGHINISQQTENPTYNFHIVLCGRPRIVDGQYVGYTPGDKVFPAGTYTFSYLRSPFYYPGPGFQGEVRCYNLSGERVFVSSDGSDSYVSKWGYIHFTTSEPCYFGINIYFGGYEGYYYYADFYPQLELGDTMTEYEGVNPATVTTVTLDSALTAGEYLSYADQKRYPGGTAVTMPALTTLQGDNVLTIDNHPRATNNIYVKYKV